MDAFLLHISSSQFKAAKPTLQPSAETDKFLLAAACCNKSMHQGSRLQNPRFNLLHHIQLVHLLSLPAMSANLHLLFPMHASRQKVGFFGGASVHIHTRKMYIHLYGGSLPGGYCTTNLWLLPWNVHSGLPGSIHRVCTFQNVVCKL